MASSNFAGAPSLAEASCWTMKRQRAVRKLLISVFARSLLEKRRNGFVMIGFRMTDRLIARRLVQQFI